MDEFFLKGKKKKAVQIRDWIINNIGILKSIILPWDGKCVSVRRAWNNLNDRSEGINIDDKLSLIHICIKAKTESI